MGVNTLGYFGQPPASRSVFLASNPNQQQQVTLYGQSLNFALKATQAIHLPPGNSLVTSTYSTVQVWDQAAMVWRNFNSIMVASDSANFQVVNTTGGVTTTTITGAGASLANGFYGYNQSLAAITVIGGATTLGNPYLVVTQATNDNGALYNCFIGGSITSVTITSGGSGFTEAPNLIVVPPAAQGSQPYLPARLTCTISAGVINAVTVSYAGAGYVAAPTVLVVPQQSDTANAYSTTVLTPVMGGSGTLTGLTVASPGTAAAGGTPTLSFGGTSGGGGCTATVGAPAGANTDSVFVYPI